MIYYIVRCFITATYHLHGCRLVGDLQVATSVYSKNCSFVLFRTSTFELYIIYDLVNEISWYSLSKLQNDGLCNCSCQKNLNKAYGTFLVNNFYLFG